MKSQLAGCMVGSAIAVLVSGPLPAVQGQATNLINDGTTMANLVLLQNEFGAGNPPASLGLTPVGEELEASQTAQYSDFHLSGVWYDARYSAISGGYLVQADARPAVGYPEYVVGVMGWLDPAAGKGIAFRVVPSAAAPFQVATLDFAAPVWEDNDSVADLYQLDGTPATAGPGSAWGAGGEYRADVLATLGLQMTPPSASDLAAVPGATARLTARVHQGGVPVGETVELLTTLPIPASHRFGYFASWGTSLFPGEVIGYLDSLRFVGDLKIENQQPAVAISSPADGSRFHVPQPVTISVTATDPEGRLSRVDLFQGGILVGTTNRSPADFVVSGLAMGNFVFQGRATDELGAVGESGVVRIEMLAPLVPPQLENPRALPSTADFREFGFRATGLGGGTYRVEASTNLTVWTSVATGAITGPSMEFTVPRSAAEGAGNYRLVVVP